MFGWVLFGFIFGWLGFVGFFVGYFFIYFGGGVVGVFCETSKTIRQGWVYRNLNFIMRLFLRTSYPSYFQHNLRSKVA